MNEALKRLVWDRAQSACEYCRLPQSLDVLPFQIDHIIAEQHHGPTVAENLALFCLNDNLYKGIQTPMNSSRIQRIQESPESPRSRVSESLSEQCPGHGAIP